MPKDPAHSALCKRIEKLLEHRLGDLALVRLQDPIQLSPYSEPEPDIAVVHPHANFYADHHPTPDEVYLIIEIADTTSDRRNPIMISNPFKHLSLRQQGSNPQDYRDRRDCFIPLRSIRNDIV